MAVLVGISFPSPLTPAEPVYSPFGDQGSASLGVTQSPGPYIEYSAFGVLVSLSGHVLISSLSFMFCFLFLVALRPFRYALYRAYRASQTSVLVGLCLQVIYQVDSPLIHVAY